VVKKVEKILKKNGVTLKIELVESQKSKIINLAKKKENKKYNSIRRTFMSSLALSRSGPS